MKKLILTQEISCQYCYKCLRNCPVKSIMFNKGKSYVIDDECVLCGVCIEVCPQKARTYVKSTHLLENFKGKPFLVSIAPSFFAHFDEPFKVITFLKNFGAAVVQETAVGADIVSYYYKKFIQGKNKTVITTACPVVFELAEKYYPDVIPYLIPFLSPMNAHALFMKKYFGDFPVIYLGPCIAKKRDGENYVDLVLTYEELSLYMERSGINITELEESLPTPPYPERGRIYPVSGGINSTLDGSWENYLVVEGIENIIKVFENISSYGEGFVIEASSCFGGCINGPAIRKDIGILEKRKRILSYMEKLKEINGEIIKPELINLDLKRNFSSQKKIIEIPEERIRKVLREMGKDNPKKELNCGACGYPSCRDKAIAVILGKAEKEMCITYLIDKVSSVSSAIIEEFPNIVIIYKDGKPIYLNPAGEDFFLNKEALLGFIIDEIEEGKNPLEIYIDNEEYYFFVKKFNLPDDNGKVALLLDITNEKKREDELNKLKKESAERIEELINRQMLLAQEIASLLGESIAETKSHFAQFRKVLEEDAHL
ncbi:MULTISPECIES: [Fe-Fe] hydrogenase large subunit C-terminal domain-containing protein [Dictyoglomus]|uniref:4Fe-4S ferredoxin iron-sulfur binding domain protein n=1 Tax=Dictyoglomus turgidum (strain DSM 6724 / Z-1310) TaxID=515635 RepID=B8DZB3_DICTD|nr:MULTISPECIES: [Fe-Fe] hydrogenase large subunit C-terminal domain-containing protein [Dictyoglomus]ACK41846.1 4Fe-4S ferredoxin iron-sulfur binding domain protein [Dictyoglomus turgidum DSM 6724]HBU31299.1 4Fe-4S ferredoxin [Dictyoglomus sp.]